MLTAFMTSLIKVICYMVMVVLGVIAGKKLRNIKDSKKNN